MRGGVMVTAMSGSLADTLILAMPADTGISDQSATAMSVLRISSLPLTISATAVSFRSSGKISGWIAYTAHRNRVEMWNHTTSRRADRLSMQPLSARNKNQEKPLWHGNSKWEWSVGDGMHSSAPFIEWRHGSTAKLN